MGAVSSGSSRNRVKLLVLILALPLSVMAVELVFRARAYHLNYGTLEGAFTRQPHQAPSGRTRFYDLIQPSANDKLVYELRPNLKTEYSGRPLTTNSAGFRMPEFRREKVPGMVTVVGLGASIMFGHGVGDNEDFFSVMAQIVRERHPENIWRMINTAVPSYNVVMKVETMKEKGLQYQPELVVLGIASNNLDLPNYIRVEEDPFDFSTCFIFDFLRERRGIEEETAKRFELASVDRPMLSWGYKVATDPEKIPERYRGLVGWAPFYKALDELKQLSVDHGFEVIVVTNLDYDLVGSMLDAARERGFHVLLTMDDIVGWIKDKYDEPFSIERYSACELVVNTENLHPSVIQHRMIGRRLADELEATGMLARAAAKAPKPRP